MWNGGVLLLNAGTNMNNLRFWNSRKKKKTQLFFLPSLFPLAQIHLPKACVDRHGMKWAFEPGDLKKQTVVLRKERILFVQNWGSENVPCQNCKTSLAREGNVKRCREMWVERPVLNVLNILARKVFFSKECFIVGAKYSHCHDQLKQVWIFPPFVKISTQWRQGGAIVNWNVLWSSSSSIPTHTSGVRDVTHDSWETGCPTRACQQSQTQRQTSAVWPREISHQVASIGNVEWSKLVE